MPSGVSQGSAGKDGGKALWSGESARVEKSGMRVIGLSKIQRAGRAIGRILVSLYKPRPGGAILTSSGFGRTPDAKPATAAIASIRFRAFIYEERTRGTLTMSP